GVEYLLQCLETNRSITCAIYIFFFQAEDGIRDRNVTGVQTCALPICDFLNEIKESIFMSKNNHANPLENHDLDNFSKTGYSNSRLDAHTVCISEPKLSFDAMTIVGNLNRDNAQALSKFMSVEPQIRLWDMLQTKLKAKALQEKVYIEYDKVKADSWDRRNMRIEFNPNKLTRDEMIWLKQNILSYMEDDGFTRLDLAFDFEDDLSDYYAMSDKAVKKTLFYG